MSSTHITYRIKLSEEKTEEFDYELDEDTFDLISKNPDDLPEWTALEFNQCPHCPLSLEENKYCPVAVQLYNILDRFHDTTSVDKVEVEVISQSRKVIKNTDLQSAISSLLGLVFPLSGCPKTEYMKPMSRFHLPLVTEEESIFHVTGMYLLSQYFRDKGRISDPFKGLAEIYSDLHILNKAVKERITRATHSDSIKNAITLIDMYSTLIPILIEDELVELKGFFNAYFSDEEKADQHKDASEAPGFLAKAKAFKLELMPISGEESEEDKEKKNTNPFLIEEEETEETKAQETETEQKKEPEIDIESQFNISGLSLEPIEDGGEASEKNEDNPENESTGKASFAIDNG